MSATAEEIAVARTTDDKPRIQDAKQDSKKAQLKIWIDGKFYDKSDAKISVYDHGLLYGDGVFEGIRCYSGKIFECEAHIRRLYDSAKAIRLEIPYTQAQFTGFIEETIKLNNFTDCYIRAVVTRGAGDLGIDPRKSKKPSAFIITDSIAIYPKELYEKGIAVVVASVIRNHPNALNPRIKSLNYLNNILAKMEANDAGCSEAVMLNHVGNVAECTADNIFVVRDGAICTPPVTEGALEGITRKVMFKLAAKLGVSCTERVVQRIDLYTADEMFLTGSGAEVMPVTQVDKRLIGDGRVGAITKRVIEAFHKHIRE